MTGQTPRVAMVLVGIALLAGCASPVQETWTKPGVTHQDVTRDVSDCERQATVDPTHGQEQGAYSATAYRRDERVFGACMRARGYALASRG